jgi:UDP-glucuronate 4-epimerase
MLKILVTGCSGFIGSHLILRLIENNNYQIIGLDINPLSVKFNNLINKKIKEKVEGIENELIEKSKFKFYQEDINNTKLESINIEKPDIVIHLAALAGVGKSCSNPLEYIDVNIKGTTNLILNCLNVNVKKIIYASSSSVYGNEDNYDFLQTTSHLQSPYSITKKTCEMIFDYYNRMNNLSCIGLRFFSVYGPNGRKDMAPYIFIDSIINNKTITINGDGNVMRDFTFISDIIDGIISSINYINNENNGVFHEIFNLGNGNPVSLNNFIQYIENIVNKKALISYGLPKKYDNDITYADLNKSKRLLNYKPKINLNDGLILTINEYYNSIVK